MAFALTSLLNCKTILHYNYIMKTCSICKILKIETDFYYRDKRTNKLHAQCKSCYNLKRKETYKQHYHTYKSEYRERAIIRNRRLKDLLRVKTLEYLKDKSCVMCGMSDPRVLDFDHINPTTKSFGIARALHNIMAWEKVLAEIEKCQILCANCHRIKTSTQQNWYKNPIN